MDKFIIYTLTAMLLFAILFCLLKIIFTIKNMKHNNNKIIGKVVAIKKQFDIGGGNEGAIKNNKYIYFPVVEYTNSKGKKKIFESTVGSYPPEFKIGDSYKLLEDSKSITEASYIENIAPELGCLVICLLAFLVFLLPILLSK